MVMAARSDGDHVPSARRGEYQRSGSCTGGQSRLPDLASVACVERAKVVVERRADEHEARLRGCRTAEIRRAGRCTGAGQPCLAQVTQRHPPSNFAAFRVDRNELSPRRSAARDAGRRNERLTRHGVGCAILLGGLPRRESLLRLVELRPRKQANDGGPAIDRRNEYLIYEIAGARYSFGDWPRELAYEYLKDVRTYVFILGVVYLYRLLLLRLRGEARLLVAQDAGPPVEAVDRPARFLVRKLRAEFLVPASDISGWKPPRTTSTCTSADTSIHCARP